MLDNLLQMQIQKTAEATVDLIDFQIADKITRTASLSNPNTASQTEANSTEILIERSLEKRNRKLLMK